MLILSTNRLSLIILCQIFPIQACWKKNCYSTKTGEPWIHGKKEHGAGAGSHLPSCQNGTTIGVTFASAISLPTPNKDRRDKIITVQWLPISKLPHYKPLFSKQSPRHSLFMLIEKFFVSNKSYFMQYERMCRQASQKEAYWRLTTKGHLTIKY